MFCCDYYVTLNEKCIAEIKKSDSIEIVLYCNLRLSQTRFWSHFKIVSQKSVNQNLNCILCCKSEKLFIQPRTTWHFAVTYCMTVNKKYAVSIKMSNPIMHIMPITNKILVTLEGSALRLCKSKLSVYHAA